jgi:hypothetical protein
VSIDVHERVSVVTGGFIPLTVFLSNQGIAKRRYRCRGDPFHP